MKAKFIKTLFVIICGLFALSGYAQEIPTPIGKKEKEKIIDTIVKDYSNWGRVSLTGKLSSPMLPATATVKVFMEKNKLTLISVAAPLLGEVARIELDSDYLLVVNKWSKKYVKVQTADLERIYPGAQSDLQNLLLGRITVMGKGSLGKRSGDDVEIYDIGQGDMMIVANEKYQPEGASYAYVVGGVEYLLSQFIMLTDNGGNELNCYFDWTSDGMAMEFIGYSDKFSLEGKITFGAPAWGAKPIDRIELTSKYSETSIRNILQM